MPVVRKQAKPKKMLKFVTKKQTTPKKVVKKKKVAKKRKSNLDEIEHLGEGLEKGIKMLIKQ